MYSAAQGGLVHQNVCCKRHSSMIGNPFLLMRMNSISLLSVVQQYMAWWESTFSHSITIAFCSLALFPLLSWSFFFILFDMMTIILRISRCDLCKCLISIWFHYKHWFLYWILTQNYHDHSILVVPCLNSLSCSLGKRN